MRGGLGYTDAMQVFSPPVSSGCIELLILSSPALLIFGFVADVLMPSTEKHLSGGDMKKFHLLVMMSKPSVPIGWLISNHWVVLLLGGASLATVGNIL